MLVIVLYCALLVTGFQFRPSLSRSLGVEVVHKPEMANETTVYFRSVICYDMAGYGMALLIHPGLDIILRQSSEASKWISRGDVLQRRHARDLRVIRDGCIESAI